MTGQTLPLETQGQALAIMNKGIARIKRTYAPRTLARFSAASNDAAYANDRDRAVELDGWARRTSSASGFGDAQVEAQVMPQAHDAYQGMVEARAARSARLAGLVTALIAAMSATGHRLRASWSSARAARATYLALRDLDSHTLHDLGLDRSEMRSVAAEIAGQSDRTRVQALRTLRALSLF
jgi:uncharacterized protein YjiS (DUF1127 family)